MAGTKQGLTPMELSSFCSEVALMLGAGMALYSGMEALEKTYENDPHAQLYQAISSGVVETGSLHDALEATHAFPRYMVEMCGIGEQTGHLEEVMQGLSVYYERESRIRQAVRSAVTYPLVLAVMMVLILLVLIAVGLPLILITGYVSLGSMTGRVWWASRCITLRMATHRTTQVVLASTFLNSVVSPIRKRSSEWIISCAGMA